MRLSQPERRIDQYPHELSGGMRQRVMIAMGLSCNPQLLIADEPTTALDATLEVQIIHLLKELQEVMGCSILFISHHLGVIAELCDDVVVMYAGRVVEEADTVRLFCLFAAPPERDLEWSEQGVEGGFRFLNRVWRLATMVMEEIKDIQPFDGNPRDLEDELRELLTVASVEGENFLAY